MHAQIQSRQVVLPGRPLNVKVLKHLSEGYDRFCNYIQGGCILLLYLQRILKGQNIWVPDLLQDTDIRYAEEGLFPSDMVVLTATHIPCEVASRHCELPRVSCHVDYPR